jgi:hypothetical protein
MPGTRTPGRDGIKNGCRRPVNDAAAGQARAMLARRDNGHAFE